jgi:predicted porin
MKLKQIALAAAVVAASSAALADVTVYGIADVNLNNGKTEAGFDGYACDRNPTSPPRTSIHQPRPDWLKRSEHQPHRL